MTKCCRGHARQSNFAKQHCLTASLVPAEVPLLRVFTSTLQPGASSLPVPAKPFKLQHMPDKAMQQQQNAGLRCQKKAWLSAGYLVPEHTL